MNQYHTEHIPFQNATKLKANYKNVTTKNGTVCLEIFKYF